MTEDNEVLRGISARIENALNMIVAGDSVKAISALKKILKVLPKASQRNVDAAHG